MAHGPDQEEKQKITTNKCYEYIIMNYPYKCKQGHIFEVMKPVSQIDRPEKCPECGEITENRRISVTQFFFREKPGGLSIIDNKRASKN